MGISKDGEKIAILGGGFGSLCAAFELSDPKATPNYDITLYQLGWRLGGKGASGRDQSDHDRIEEHGIHAFLVRPDHAVFGIARTASVGAGPGGIDRSAPPGPQ